jgi:hypothetical protein
MDDEAREAGGDDPNKLEREGGAGPERLWHRELAILPEQPKGAADDGRQDQGGWDGREELARY